MSTLFLILFFALLITAGGALVYKIYLQMGIKNPGKKGAGLFQSFAVNLNVITYFLPMSVKYKSPEETERRKKANRALAVFYISFVCILLLSLVMK